MQVENDEQMLPVMSPIHAGDMKNTFCNFRLFTILNILQLETKVLKHRKQEVII